MGELETAAQRFLLDHIPECAQGPAALLELVSSDDMGAAVLETVETAIKDQAIAREIEARSSRHVNGFLRLTFASSQHFGLRLHVWDTRKGGLPYTPESIHNHTVDLASKLVSGGYVHTVYRNDGVGDERLSRYLFTGQRDARSFSLVADGETTVSVTQVENLPAGVSYGLGQPVLHAVHPYADALTASIVLKGPAVSDRAIVLASHEPAIGAEVPVIDMPPDALRRYCTELLPVLG